MGSLSRYISLIPRTTVAKPRFMNAIVGPSCGSNELLSSTTSKRTTQMRSFASQLADTNNSTNTKLHVNKFVIIGGGNMAEAFTMGITSRKLVPNHKIVVSDPNPRKFIWYL